MPTAPFTMSPPLKTRARLSEVRYEIRGELARRARELEAQGRQLIKLNIGNPGAFGFRAPEHLQQAITGRIAATVSILLAILTARPLLGRFDQAFQYIQEYT